MQPFTNLSSTPRAKLLRLLHGKHEEPAWGTWTFSSCRLRSVRSARRRHRQSSKPSPRSRFYTEIDR